MARSGLSAGISNQTMLAACFFSDVLMFFLSVDVILGIQRTSRPTWDKIFFAKSSGPQRSAAIVSEGTLVLIWCPRVQTISGIVRRRLADCPSAFRIRLAQHRADNTSSTC